MTIKKFIIKCKGYGLSPKELTIYNKEQKAEEKERAKKDWFCNHCWQPAYYDGRCGDGPILMCDCSRRSEAILIYKTVAKENRKKKLIKK